LSGFLRDTLRTVANTQITHVAQAKPRHCIDNVPCPGGVILRSIARSFRVGYGFIVKMP